MRVLVSGGGGFIGRRLVRVLLLGGHQVRVLDNFKLGGKSYLRDITTSLDAATNMDIVEADIRNYSKVEKALRDIDLVYHLAAPSSFLMYEQAPLDSSIITIQGFLNILEGMRINGVRKIIYISTSAVYEGNTLPYREDMNVFPPDLKAITRKFNEEVAKQYSQRYGLQVVIMRPFSVYGYGEETKEGYANITSLFIWAMLNGNRPVVWGDGKQTRDFIFVDDVIDALLLAQNKNFSCEIFNVGTGIETSFNEIIQIINAQLRTNLQPIYVPIQIDIYAHRLLADVTRQKTILESEPKITIEEGIAKTIESARKTIERKEKLSSCQRCFTK
jgi:UDP-glucose 4-epimerase